MKLTFAPLLALSLFVSAQGHAQQLQPLDRIAAVVNEDVVLESELNRALNNIRSQYAGRSDQLPPEDILRRQVLERLILMKIQTAGAAERGIRVSDSELDNAVSNIAQQNRMTPDQLRQQLASEGIAFNDFRDSLRDELMMNRMRQSFAQSRINVTEAEVDAALAAQTSGGAQYQLAHILVALPEGATAEQIATGQKKIDGVKTLLDKGEMTFSAAAVRYSDSPNALEGGDLGWRSIDEIPPAFAANIDTMQKGQIIGPTRGPSGFQLIQLVDTRNNEGGSTVTQYRARHILLRAGDNAQDSKAKASLDAMRARIQGGADFAELAKDDSQDSATQDKGGELGWFTQDQFGPEFGQQIAALRAGQISEPFKTQAGWHIVQLEETRQAPVTDQNRRAQVREAIGMRKLEDEWNRYLYELRGEAYVDIRNADGTSAGDTQADSAAPPAKATP